MYIIIIAKAFNKKSMNGLISKGDRGKPTVILDSVMINSVMNSVSKFKVTVTSCSSNSCCECAVSETPWENLSNELARFFWVVKRQWSVWPPIYSICIHLEYESEQTCYWLVKVYSNLVSYTSFFMGYLLKTKVPKSVAAWHMMHECRKPHVRKLSVMSTSQKWNCRSAQNIPQIRCYNKINPLRQKDSDSCCNYLKGYRESFY